MARNFIIAVLVAIIISAFIVLSGCLLPSAGKMKTGEITAPPAGWVDWMKRTEK